ncbi:MAG TPA: peptidase M28, partial [Granulicella sp.]
MRILRTAVLPLLALSTAALAHAQTQPVPASVKTAEASVDPEKIRSHVKFLSDDLLEGRGPGT